MAEKITKEKYDKLKNRMAGWIEEAGHYKDKYTALKSYSDAEISTLNSTIIELKSNIISLRQEIQRLDTEYFDKIRLMERDKRKFEIDMEALREQNVELSERNDKLKSILQQTETRFRKTDSSKNVHEL